MSDKIINFEDIKPKSVNLEELVEGALEILGEDYKVFEVYKDGKLDTTWKDVELENLSYLNKLKLAIYQ